MSRLDNIAQVEDATQDSDKFSAYAYLGAGTIVEVAHPAVTNGLTLTYKGAAAGSYAGFDRFGRVVDQRWQNSTPTVKDQFKYGYDRASNRTWREVAPDGGNPTGFDEYYTYDGLDRLERSQRGTLSGSPYSGVTSPTKTQDFGLEALGNWKTFKEDDDATLDWDVLDQSRTHNPVNETTGITGGSWIVPAYDAAGNMTAGPRPGKENHRQWYVWDAWNRLVAVWMDDGDNQREITGEDPDDILMAEYRYDALHRRIAKIVPNGENWDRTDYYYTPGGQVAEERFEDAQANKDTPAASAKFQYVWDIRYVHAAVLRDEDTDSGGDCTDEGSERLYYTQDANFNVTALVETDGDVIERYVYDPYGKRTIYDDDWSDEITWANSKKNEILYTGHRLNPESGLYYAGARYYDPVLGCWISWDWTGYADSMNLYAYVSSSPLTRIDPLGLMEKFDTPEKIRKQLGATIEDPSKAVGAGEISTSTTTLTVRVGENVEPGTAKDAQVEYHETVGLIAMRFTGGAGEASKLVVGPRGYIPPSWEETEAEQSGKPYEGVSLPYYDLVQFVTGWHNLAMMVEFAAYARMVKPEEQSPCCYAKLRWGHHGFQPYGGAHVAPPGKTPIPWQENLRGMIRWMCKCEEEGISEPYKYYYSTGVKGLVFKESFNVEIVLKCLANKVAVDTFKMQYWD